MSYEKRILSGTGNAAAHQIDLEIGNLFPRERAVLNVYDSVGEREQPRIMGHHQNGAASLLGDRMRESS